MKLNGLISTCSNWLVSLGGKSIKTANEETQDLPSLRTANFLTSLKKSVVAIAELNGSTFDITCILAVKN